MAELQDALAKIQERVHALIERANNSEVPALRDALALQTQAYQELQESYEVLVSTEAAEDAEQQATIDQGKADLEQANADAQAAADALEALLAEIDAATEEPAEETPVEETPVEETPADVPPQS